MHKIIQAMGATAFLAAALSAISVCSMGARGAQEAEAKILATTEGPVALSTLPTRVSLAAASAQGSAGGTLAAQLRELPAGGKIRVVLRDLRASAAPGVLFHIYLDLPEGAKPALDDAHYVGSFNMFNDVVPEGTPVNDASPGAKRLSFRSYNITQMARKLEVKHQLTEQTTLTILASRPAEEGSKPVIGRIEIVEQ